MPARCLLRLFTEPTSAFEALMTPVSAAYVH